jgi:hypothetical protein
MLMLNLKEFISDIQKHKKPFAKKKAQVAQLVERNFEGV